MWVVRQEFKLACEQLFSANAPHCLGKHLNYLVEMLQVHVAHTQIVADLLMRKKKEKVA